ncbi:hypothetical protein C4J93_2148 [Pseudomonas sp. R2-37-08W]|nr:hypothetical protein C4J93_2148 [Pseudomonas sp. R2-37-08W]AZF15572.1 hypothetical protein C4J92_2088 [Pseudomonas sp. R3-18-08]AZF20878.1 hypothetical protein C4J91_2128 [Pseudomonas sp. R3-52-08]AZF26218.1 hypothetical protein C4J90_2045 [Pseudomonas sp. R2-60-08W]AZF31583.1 hypothetical protein C4J89_2108 [Pseudomonas sp. R4-35-07]AZF36858.1 hypothetical protein C4J88_2075 [Pseudomonas sp. R4-39-08]AZF52525.1 hypothetical protein C4J85_2040 [Pseudomonas sp. R4-34-07]MDQ0741122.1 hypoth
MVLSALKAITGTPYRIDRHDRDEIALAFAAITSSINAMY